MESKFVKRAVAQSLLSADPIAMTEEQLGRPIRDGGSFADGLLAIQNMADLKFAQKRVLEGLGDVHYGSPMSAWANLIADLGFEFVADFFFTRYRHLGDTGPVVEDKVSLYVRTDGVVLELETYRKDSERPRVNKHFIGSLTESDSKVLVSQYVSLMPKTITFSAVNWILGDDDPGDLPPLGKTKREMLIKLISRHFADKIFAAAQAALKERAANAEAVQKREAKELVAAKAVLAKHGLIAMPAPAPVKKGLKTGSRA